MDKPVKALRRRLNKRKPNAAESAACGKLMAR
jgi:hypothetical protein